MRDAHDVAHVLVVVGRVSIHQHDALIEVGGFAVDAVDFLQQAAAGEGYLWEVAADEDGDVLGLPYFPAAAVFRPAGRSFPPFRA